MDAETRTKHRNPLYNPDIGISVDILLVDLLHAFYLGVLKTFCANLAWEFILSDAWGVNEGRIHEEQVLLSIEKMSDDLFAFYKRHREAQPDRQLTQLQCLIPTMVGARNKRVLRTKAAEAKGFFLFLHDLIRRRGGSLASYQPWKDSADCLHTLIRIWSEAPMVCNVATQQARKFWAWL